MRIILTLFLALAAASALEPAAESYDEHRLLRGPNDTEDNEDRDLQFTIGSTSESYSFSASSAHSSKDFCYDYYSSCIETGYAMTSAYSYADADGNAIAFGASVEYLFLMAYCDSFAKSYALTCAFSKVDGDIYVDTKTENYKQVVTLGLKLKAASTTFAKASSEAEALAYTGIESEAYTEAGAAMFCAKYPYYPNCQGYAASGLQQIAEATAKSFAVASSESGSSAEAKSGAFVVTAGSKYAYVNGFISAYVKAWSFAQADAAAKAFADSYTETINNSFAEVCVKQFESICSIHSYGYCSSPPEEACSLAWASGKSWAYALSIACAKAFVSAYAKASSFVFLTANVDCSKPKPYLTWTTTNAGAVNYCSA
jgi:hypothetical protein